MNFKPINPKQSFPELEKNILDFWDKNKIFEKSLEKNKDKEKTCLPAGRFVFYEGPPTANGKPGIHHVLARSFKDIICRYKTMKGFYVARRAGWDTHGLPVEIEVEKALGISGKDKIEEYGVEKFNQKCRESVFKYKDEWEKLTKRIGFWIDMEKPYITYENSYIEKVWGILKEIYDKGLLYEGYKVVPYCPRCGSTLSSHEVAQGYKTVDDQSIYIKFKIKNPSAFSLNPNTYLLVWTTTPWTLPGNIALAVGADISYVEIENDGENLIVSKDRLEKLFHSPKIIKEYKGTELEGIEYEPLFENSEFIKEPSDKNFKVWAADFVTTEEGTGIVHIAPAFGEDDLALQNKAGFSVPMTVAPDGSMLFGVGKSKFIKLADKDIKEDLRARDHLFKEESIRHEYPFCWRCDTPLMYYAKTSWFIAMSKLRDKLITNNEEINWIPSYIKEGRFGGWLKEAKDWALSRERYWGTPLPIWECECGEKTFIGSIDELKSKALKNIEKIDLHRPYVDDIKIKCPKCGKETTRVKDLIDVWFDSGSMPFASGEFPENYPADFISEAIDQTRGWFYTILAISTLLDKGASYKNVICLGHVLDQHGKKMSKSKGNILDPWQIIDKYGTDSVRWFFFTVNAPGEPKRMADKDVAETSRKFNLILWNVYTFFVTYANIDNWEPNGQKKESSDILDKWILSYANNLTKIVQEKLDNYDVVTAAREIELFNTDLSTWYLRRSRKRRDENFYSTLYSVLVNLCKLIAPFTPFLAEEIYQNLNKTEVESIHLGGFAEEGEVDTKLLDEMKQVRYLAEKGRAFRAESGIRNRQPLASFTIDKKISIELQEILKEELNVTEITIGSEIKLDTVITAELKKEGDFRDLLRVVQDLRKKAGLKAGENTNLLYETSSSIFKEIINQKKAEIEKLTNVSLKDSSRSSVLAEIDYTIDSEEIWLGIK